MFRKKFRLIFSLMLFSFISCKLPWLKPGCTIETFANHKEDGYNYIKYHHDVKYPKDKLKYVISAKIHYKQDNGMGTVEKWIIETESGKKFEYILQIAYYVGAGRVSGTTVQYGIVTFKEI